MYLTELAPARLTGAMGVACPMGVNVGVLVGQVMGLDFILGECIMIYFTDRISQEYRGTDD